MYHSPDASEEEEAEEFFNFDLSLDSSLSDDYNMDSMDETPEMTALKEQMRKQREAGLTSLEIIDQALGETSDEEKEPATRMTLRRRAKRAIPSSPPSKSSKSSKPPSVTPSPDPRSPEQGKEAEASQNPAPSDAPKGEDVLVMEEAPKRVEDAGTPTASAPSARNAPGRTELPGLPSSHADGEVPQITIVPKPNTAPVSTDLLSFSVPSTHSMVQPIMPSVMQSMVQPVVHSVMPSVMQPMMQPVMQSMVQPVVQPMVQPMVQPLVHSLPITSTLPSLHDSESRAASTADAETRRAKETEKQGEDGVDNDLSFEYSIPVSGPVTPVNPLQSSAHRPVLSSNASLPVIGQTPMMNSLPSQLFQSPIYSMVVPSSSLMPPYSGKKSMMVSIPFASYTPNNPEEGVFSSSLQQPLKMNAVAVPAAPEAEKPGAAPPTQESEAKPDPVEPPASSAPVPLYSHDSLPDHPPEPVSRDNCNEKCLSKIEKSVPLDIACREAGVVMYNCNVEIKAINNYGLNMAFQEELKQRLSEISREIAQLKQSTSFEGLSQTQMQEISSKVDRITHVLQTNGQQETQDNIVNVSV